MNKLLLLIIAGLVLSTSAIAKESNESIMDRNSKLLGCVVTNDTREFLPDFRTRYWSVYKDLIERNPHYPSWLWSLGDAEEKLLWFMKTRQWKPFMDYLGSVAATVRFGNEAFNTKPDDDWNTTLTDAVCEEADALKSKQFSLDQLQSLI